MQNVIALREILVKDVMTPKTVVFSLSELMTVGDYFNKYEKNEFSRIPIYGENKNDVNGFVLRNELLLAFAKGDTSRPLRCWSRDLHIVPDMVSIAKPFDQLVQNRAHILLVIDEHGDGKGIITLEDILETILGLEIIDENDKVVDMRELARQLWRRRAQRMGLDNEKNSLPPSPPPY